MSSTLRSNNGANPRAVAEVRWCLANFGLYLAVIFGWAAVQGVILLVSYGGTVLGGEGSPVTQVVFYALYVVLVGGFILGLLPFVAVLIIWRVTIAIVGHPRLTAYALAALIVGLVWQNIPGAGIPYVIPSAIVVALVYATLVRLPPGRATVGRGDPAADG